MTQTIGRAENRLETKLALAWKPLIPVPSNVPAAALIQGTDAGAFFDDYMGRVRSDFAGAPPLRALWFDESNQLVCGSSPYAAVLANQIVRPQGMRCATPGDLERLIALDEIPLRGVYSDAALVWREGTGPNGYLAARLRRQAAARGPIPAGPLLIPLAGLELELDRQAPHGLGLRLRDEAEVFPASVLAHEGAFASTDVELLNGLPRKLGGGERTLFGGKGGLSRYYVGGRNGIYTNDTALDFSRRYGRLILARGEVPPNSNPSGVVSRSRDAPGRSARVTGAAEQGTSFLS